ncbi:MAG: redoxin domain-containing protein [Mucilaginibacter sp.]
MLVAASNTSKYPYFDMSEIITDHDLTFKPHQPLQPIKAGNILPDFPLQKENAKWQQFFNGAEIHGPVLLRQLLNKPLVIGFYSHHWQQYGIDLLKQLDAIQKDIRASGGNILIIGSETEKKLEKIAWDNSLSLSFYFDVDKEIAQQFRIYSEHFPIWNTFSGIDTNVPLLATYVISTNGQIVYDHVDLDFSKDFPSEDIISAVNKADVLNKKIRNTGDPIIH